MLDCVACEKAFMHVVTLVRDQSHEENGGVELCRSGCAFRSHANPCLILLPPYVSIWKREEGEAAQGLTFCASVSLGSGDSC